MSIHIVFAGGGTGGHLFPGLAVAQRLKAEIRRPRITFVGSDKEFERRQVALAGFEYWALPCRPLPRGPREVFSFLVENLAGYLAARRLLDEENVAGVVGLGGYASVPMGRAAAKAGVPLVLLEQNVLLGRANRWLARWANLICTSFPQTESLLHCRAAVRCTGNPIRGTGEFVVPPSGGAGVRERLFRLKAGLQTPEDRPAHPLARPANGRPPQLLVLGGSGGARSLNENVPRALYKAREALAGWRIVHQSGENEAAATRELYRKLAVEATVAPFFADLPRLLAESDLAVCRAGGTTLAELAAAAVPAILLPYPHAAGDHQRHNAQVFTAAGGALLIDERRIAGRLDDALAGAIAPLAGNARRRAWMSAAVWSLARPHAARDVAALVWSVISSRSNLESGMRRAEAA